MFRTNESQLKGRFKMPDGNLLMWKSIDLSHNQYSLLVEGVGLVDGRIGPNMRLVIDAEAVNTLCNTGDLGFLGVTKIYLLSPPWMNRQGQHLLEPLTEIKLQRADKEPPIYEFVTMTGQTYTSVREHSSI